jgi:NAD+ synthase (glutamine-hydrolysing)
VGLTTAQIDVDATRMNLARTGSFQPDLVGDWKAEVACPFSYPDLEPEVAELETAPWETSPRIKEEEFTRAVALGLFDYLRKSRSRGFVVSLSGGADSSATACLVALMTELASQELDEEGFASALAHLPELGALDNPRDRVQRLLHCVYQATENSSQSTRNAATTLARALGAEMSVIEIDELVRLYVSGAEEAIGRQLTWQADDLALQNIQARVRGPNVWLLANVKGALLLATSNRSEAAVGYATMDGDTCGGLSPIAGIDKAFLRRWLHWLEHDGPMGLHAIPALSAVNSLTPTAELRPLEQGQTDEDDLMPYEVLDPIERAAIRDKQTPLEVFRLMRSQFPQYGLDQLHQWVERFFHLWCRNQWKRERYAPSFHLDDENLDPKSWCRFPILSGGFVKELQQLQAYVEGLKAEAKA